VHNIEKIKSNKEEIEYLKVLFPSYPKTAYLNNSSLQTAQTVDDISIEWESVLVEVQKYSFQSPISLLIQEKMDGSNAGMMFDQDKLGSKDGHIHVRNRDHILRKNYLVNKDSASKSQFLPFFNKAHSMQKSLARLNKECGQVVGVYGEWMYALHSTAYDELPNDFFAFDIWLSQDRKFLDPVLAFELLQATGFEVPHTLAHNSSMSLDALECSITQVLEAAKEKKWKSFYGNKDKSEGLYIKIGSPMAKILIHRFKMVRDDYQSNLYWDEKKISRQKIK